MKRLRQSMCRMVTDAKEKHLSARAGVWPSAWLSPPCTHTHIYTQVKNEATTLTKVWRIRKLKLTLSPYVDYLSHQIPSSCHFYLFIFLNKKVLDGKMTAPVPKLFTLMTPELNPPFPPHATQRQTKQRHTNTHNKRSYSCGKFYFYQEAGRGSAITVHKVGKLQQEREGGSRGLSGNKAEVSFLLMTCKLKENTKCSLCRNSEKSCIFDWFLSLFFNPLTAPNLPHSFTLYMRHLLHV